MLTIEITDEMAERLASIAKQRETTIQNALNQIILHYSSPLDAALAQRTDALAFLARTARNENWGSGRNDTVERSREILNHEYPEYLHSRMDGNSGDAMDNG